MGRSGLSSKTCQTVPPARTAATRAKAFARVINTYPWFSNLDLLQGKKGDDIVGRVFQFLLDREINKQQGGNCQQTTQTPEAGLH